MLYQYALELVKEGHSLEEMLYVNFDDERLYGVIAAQELDEILQAYASMYPHKPVVLLDEIQNIEGWEHFARCLANQKIQGNDYRKQCQNAQQGYGDCPRKQVPGRKRVSIFVQGVPRVERDRT